MKGTNKDTRVGLMGEVNIRGSVKVCGSKSVKRRDSKVHLNSGNDEDYLKLEEYNMNHARETY
jgi:hypothetical protein